MIAAIFAAMLTTLVDTFVGTSGTVVGGSIDTFPGADLPFGMVQWSPDTPSQTAGGGYNYGDTAITGFSLTHLSGPGCSVFGDFSILPTTGEIPARPADATQPFSHTTEVSAPGSYAVSAGTPAIRTELSVTPRTGLGRFTFPATQQANLLINASSNQAGVTDARVSVDGPAEISGSASSGFFCGMPDRYTVYFVARFDRPFRSYGTWNGAHLFPGARSGRGAGTGLWLTFDTSAQRQVTMKVALSFVDLAGARANLAAENRGWDVIAVRNRATEEWSGMLNRIAIAGGTSAQQRTFYSAFYHTLLHPNVISDFDGRYMGFDNRIHHTRHGHAEYANYSDWDIYRTEVPLLALIAPGETSDMMQSLVDAYEQEGWLPRWPLVNGPSSVMGGDSVDPVIAGGYAFGARDFDLRTALAAMLKGANTTAPPHGQGWYVERWELHDEYLRRGYVVNTHTTSVAPAPNGASETLEYALDDFSIARFADAVRDRRNADDFMQRSANWMTLFDSSTGEIAPRDPQGAFMQTPVTENGQSGFQEGNAAQYTWMVPHDLHDLIAAMGGARIAVAKLDTFFSQLNADQDKPYAWLGNEPSLGSPWVYLSAGEPWRAQTILRQALTTLYNDTPDGIPGNDDLGTMSAWYMWCAMGLYPQMPAVRTLDIGAPLFTSVIVRAPNGPTIDIEAPQASTAAAYVAQVRVNRRIHNASWLSLPMRGRLRLDVTLAATPTRWASGPNDAPPSYSSVRLSLPRSTAATFGDNPGLVSLEPGGSTALTFGVSNRAGSSAETVAWHAILPNGLHLEAPNGSVRVAAGGTEHVSARLSASDAMPSGLYAAAIDASAANGALLERMRIAVRVAHDGETLDLAYVSNRFGNSLTPIDPVNGGAAPEIGVGEEPRAIVRSRDGARLYVADSGSDRVSIIDVRAARRIGTVKTGSVPMALALEPDGRTLWIVDGYGNAVEPLDTTTLRFGSAIRVGSLPRDLAITPDGSTLYVANSGSNSVTAIDLRSRSVRGEIAAGERPWGVAMAPDGKRLYVVNSASNDVTPVDLSTGRALGSIPVGVDPVAIAIAPDGTLAFVSNHANATITPIDLQAGTARPPIEVGGAPFGVAFARDGKTALVALSRDNAAVVVDVASGRAGAPIPLGNGPYAVLLP